MTAEGFAAAVRVGSDWISLRSPIPRQMPVDPPARKRNLDRVESIVRNVGGDGAGLRLCLGQKSC
jgi:hypothetical protein